MQLINKKWSRSLWLLWNLLINLESCNSLSLRWFLICRRNQYFEPFPLRVTARLYFSRYKFVKIGGVATVNFARMCASLWHSRKFVAWRSVYIRQPLISFIFVLYFTNLNRIYNRICEIARNIFENLFQRQHDFDSRTIKCLEIVTGMFPMSGSNNKI